MVTARCPRCGSRATGTSPRRGHDCVNVLIDRVATLERLLLDAHETIEREVPYVEQGDTKARKRALGLP